MRNDRATTGREDAASEATLCEDQIDIFELEALCLWVEEIDNWNPEEVENSEDHEDAPADVLCARLVNTVHVKSGCGDKQGANLRIAIGVILTTAKTESQLNAEAMAAFLDRRHVVLI